MVGRELAGSSRIELEEGTRGWNCSKAFSFFYLVQLPYSLSVWG